MDLDALWKQYRDARDKADPRVVEAWQTVYSGMTFKEAEELFGYRLELQRMQKRIVELEAEVESLKQG